MRVAALIFTIVFMFAFTACAEKKAYMQVEDSDGNVTVYEISKRTEPPTQAEKDLNFKKQLINRMQDAIKDYFKDVNEAVITVEEPSETEQNIVVAVAMKPGEQLIDEEKEGIINFIKNSFSSDLPLNVSLVQEQSKD